MNPEAFTRNLMMHRSALLDLLDKIPEDKEDLVAFEDGMTMAKTAYHILASGERSIGMIMPEGAAKPEPSGSFADTKARLKANTEKLQEILPKLSQEQLASTIEAFGGMKMPVSSLLEIVRDHEIHHKGQLWTMARMAGLEPGMFMKLG